jgi:hypothetical protein
MTTDKVARLPPLDRFLYWIRERHAVYLRRKAGRPKPWTDDSVMQAVFFTNPYRENDKVTVWFREHVRDPLKEDDRVVMATVIFRWFNLPSTAVVLMGECHPVTRKPARGRNLLLDWSRGEAVRRLAAVRSAGAMPVFTGAYLIKGKEGMGKVESVCDCITKVWDDRKSLLAAARAATTMEEVWAKLKTYDHLGGFMSYEIVCDLRYTKFLRDATDRRTWCHPGPGATRGLMRLDGIINLPKNKRGVQKRGGFRPPPDWQERIKELLKAAEARTGLRLEMREIEHSLCEWDKYERVLWNDGRSKRTYNGVK